MQQAKKKGVNHKRVDTMLQFSISGNGLETAGWIKVAFSRTTTDLKMIFSNTRCVLRIRAHDVHSNHLQKRNKNQKQMVLLCIL